MDGFTLAFLARELQDALVGGRVERVNQPERDALVLVVRSNGRNHKLLLSANADQARAQLTDQTYENPSEPPMFCMLMRKHLQGARINEIAQVNGDRVLKLVFDCIGELGDPVQKTMILEMMGRYSNLSLVDENGVILDCIRHVNGEMSRVRVLLPGLAFEMPPDQHKLNPETFTADELAERLKPFTCPLGKALIECIAGAAKNSAREACAQIGVDDQTPCDQIDIEAVSRAIAAFYRSLPEKLSPVVLSDATGQATDFFPFPYLTFDLNHQKPYPTLSEAMDAFYLGRDLRMRMRQRSAGLEKHIKTNIARLEKKKAMMLQTLQESEKAERNRIFGELLTANLHQIDKGAAEAEVTDYYDPEQKTVKIPLSPQLTPAKNAQQYYKKYRKAKSAEQYAGEQLTIIDKELELLENALDDLEKCVTSTDLSEIRTLLAEAGYLRAERGGRKRGKTPEGQPYRFASEDGTEIFVGKNALQNDRLTLHARGGETWLHAQGIPGSHVIIRSEQEPGEATLLLAAKLAAYYSKGRNHPGLPVDYTKRKYVKKAAGTPAGFVTYTNFKTILVGLTPEEIVSIGQLAAKG